MESELCTSFSPPLVSLHVLLWSEELGRLPYRAGVAGMQAAANSPKPFEEKEKGERERERKRGKAVAYWMD
jgi:hypothetical protein